jgi:predicted nucleic acid-binding protein
LAADANATHLVSGDLHLRTIHPWRGVTICTPGEFLQQAAPLQGAAKAP